MNKLKVTTSRVVSWTPKTCKMEIRPDYVAAVACAEISFPRHRADPHRFSANTYAQLCSTKFQFLKKKKKKTHFRLNLAPIVRVRKLINRSWPVVRVNGSALSETDGSPSCPIQSRHSPLNRGGLDQCVDAVAARMWHNPAEILPKFASQWTTFRHLFYSLNHLITELKCQNHHQFVEEIEEKSIDM